MEKLDNTNSLNKDSTRFPERRDNSLGALTRKLRETVTSEINKRHLLSSLER